MNFFSHSWYRLLLHSQLFTWPTSCARHNLGWIAVENSPIFEEYLKRILLSSHPPRLEQFVYISKRIAESYERTERTLGDPAFIFRPCDLDEENSLISPFSHRPFNVICVENKHNAGLIWIVGRNKPFSRIDQYSGTALDF